MIVAADGHGWREAEETTQKKRHITSCGTGGVLLPGGGSRNEQRAHTRLEKMKPQLSLNLRPKNKNRAQSKNHLGVSGECAKDINHLLDSLGGVMGKKPNRNHPKKLRTSTDAATSWTKVKN